MLQLALSLAIAVMCVSGLVSQSTSDGEASNIPDVDTQSDSYRALNKAISEQCDQNQVSDQGLPQDDTDRPNASPCQTTVYLINQEVTTSFTTPTPVDQFGYSVAISGNMAVVGAPAANSSAGAAYVYGRSGAVWSLLSGGTTAGNLATVSGVSVSASDQFGYSVDVDGSNATVVVGAPYDVVSGVRKGSAWVFKYNGSSWSKETQFLPVVDFTPNPPQTGDDTNTEDRFGQSVAISGEYVVVGAPIDKVAANPTSFAEGSASLYKRTSPGTWTAGAKKTISYADHNEYFGTSVAISGDQIIVGAPNRQVSGVATGAAFGYTRSSTPSWSSETQISGVSSGSNFGGAVSIDGTTAVIGAWVAGKAYVSSSFGSPAELPAMTGGNHNGISVAISGDMIVVGSESPSNTPGTAYIFRKCNGTWALKTNIANRETGANQFGYAVGVDGNTLLVGSYNSLSSHGEATFFVNVFRRPYDREGDNASNRGVYRTSNNYFYTYMMTPPPATTPTPSTESFNYGAANDKIVPADYDGDGKMDYAVWRPSTQIWYVWKSSTNSEVTQYWGASGDIPIPNDLDGDGKADYAVFRPSDKTWYWKKSGGGADASVQLNFSGTVKPVLADFDGDGTAEPAIFRIDSSVGYWNWYNTVTAQSGSQQWGASTTDGPNGRLINDVPTPGDFDGDSKTDIGVFRPTNGYWYILFSSDGATFAPNYGTNGDVPVVGDYDADGESDIAVFRPSDNNWYITQSLYGTSTVNFGTSGDKAVPAAYNP